MTAPARNALRTVANIISEQSWQQVVCDYAQLTGWRSYHVHDARRSNPGFPDLVLVRDRVVFVELKSPRGRLTHDQRHWIAALHAAGAEAYCWRPSDWPEVERTLTKRAPP